MSFYFLRSFLVGPPPEFIKSKNLLTRRIRGYTDIWAAPYTGHAQRVAFPQFKELSKQSRVSTSAVRAWATPFSSPSEEMLDRRLTSNYCTSLRLEDIESALYPSISNINSIETIWNLIWHFGTISIGQGRATMSTRLSPWKRSVLPTDLHQGPWLAYKAKVFDAKVSSSFPDLSNRKPHPEPIGQSWGEGPTLGSVEMHLPRSPW